MAECQKCKRDWLWDWCVDLFRLQDGTPCVQKLTKKGSFYTCVCGNPLAKMANDGSITDFNPTWKDIDWEDPKYYYQGDCN